MPIDSGNLALKGLDDLFSTEEKRQEEQREQVQQIPIDALHPFTNHPFKVLDDEAMTRTVESIAQYGVLAPLIARPRPDGDGYEIISGHRRQYAAKLAGLDTLPVIVRQMSDDAAVILMVDSNLQREHILPSERALAYKMKLEAIKNQGARSDLTSPQVAAKFRSDDAVAKDQGISGDTVRRYIRLTNLIPELLDMVDEKKISFNPAVELSYLDESQQRDFLEAMEDTQNAPSLSQAQQLKKMAQQGEFSYEKAFDVMGQEKRSEKDTVTIKNETLRKYFPRSYTPKQMEEKIIQLLDTVKEVRPRYSCFYKIRHPGDCDGQSGYGVSKLDSIVEEVVRQIFAQFREVSRKKLLESVKTNDAARIQKKVKKIQKDLESKQKELDDLKAETILVIRGVSALDKELLGTLVAEAREALETLEKQLVQAQEEYEEATKTAKRSNYICNELFTWADVYDTANHDERRAILQQFIKEIRVRKDYEISITLNASFNQVEQLKAVSTYDGAEIFEEISEKGA